MNAYAPQTVRTPEHSRPHAVVRPLLLMLLVGAWMASCDNTASAAPVSPDDYPSQWYAPLPHNGQMTDLTRWWQQFDDPLLSELVASAQAASPTIASAKSHIEQARAARVAAGASLVPALDSVTQATRGRDDVNGPLLTAGAGEIQASWETDLFGGNRASRDAAQARFISAEGAWHDARVSVAAEVARNYVQFRACEALSHESEADAKSRAETARLTELSFKSGLQSSSNLAYARASAAQGASNLTRQRAECERNVKALVALSAIDEPTLRAELAASTARIPRPEEIAVAGVPAQALAQRPDLLSAAYDVAAAQADVRHSKAQRYPKIFLNGSIGTASIDTGTHSDDGTVWSVGPVSVSMPIFDGGRRRANVSAARARYDESTTIYRARLRSAIREVEDALVTLQSAADRSDDAHEASANYQVAFTAAQDRYNAGLGSLFDLEEARRTYLEAQIAVIQLENERVTAWISLYRALGGGWSADTAAALTST